jgi:hypothetical protein
MAFGAIGKIALGWASKVVVKRAVNAFKGLNKKGIELDEKMVIDYINKHVDLPYLNEEQEAEFMHHSYGIAKVIYEASKN